MLIVELDRGNDKHLIKIQNFMEMQTEKMLTSEYVKIDSHAVPCNNTNITHCEI